jgi:long-chain acyl-CoA synthetase
VGVTRGLARGVFVDDTAAMASAAQRILVSGATSSDRLANEVRTRLAARGYDVVDVDADSDAGLVAVVHLQGANASSSRLDEAVADDVALTRALLARAKQARVPFVLGSRLSVCGGKKGLIAEVDPLGVDFGGSGKKGKDIDVDAEAVSLAAEVAFARASVGHADHDALRRQALRDRMRDAGGPTAGHGFEAALKRDADKAVGQALRTALANRAAAWRFPTASVAALRGYTRALAELFTARAAAQQRAAIVRLPTLLCAQSGDPRVDDGAHGLAGVVDRVRAGALRLPFAPRARVEVVPVDIVADAVVAVVVGEVNANVDEGGAVDVRVVHVATSDKNHLPAERLLDLLDLHLRATKGDADHEGSARPALYPLLSVDSESRLPPGLQTLRELSLGAAAEATAVMNASLGKRLGDNVGHAAAEVETSLRALQKPSATDHALCHAPPFFDDDVRFAQRGLRMACHRAGVAVVDAAAVDWRAHLLTRQLPALWTRSQELSTKKERAPLPAFDSLPHLLVEAAARHKNKAALVRFLPRDQVNDGDSDTVELSYGELLARARAAALRLEQAGVVRGDRVVIAAQNHPDWAICAFGALLLGATLVPLDANIEAAAAHNVLKKAKAKVCIVDKGVRDRVGDALSAHEVLDLHLTATTGPGLDDARIAPAALPTSTEVASILFTSGTTGDPKGVMLSHANFTALIASLLAVFPVTGTDRMLSVLPIHHTFEFSCGLLMPLAAGATVYYPDAVVGDRVLYALKAGRITAIVGVPALWQLLERRITKQTQERGELAASVFQMLLKANKAIGTRLGVSAGHILLKPVHDSLGGHLRVLISGGSALPPAVHELFQGIGLPLAEGYGLTETSPVLTVAEGKMGLPAGTVGQAIPGVELRLVDVDSGALVTAPGAMGELQAKAPNVMLGYFENESATSAVFTDDGWLKTGDLGTIAADGTVRLVGRSKDVVVSASGENIYLDDVEKKLEGIPGVFELSLFGIPDPSAGTGSGERLACVFVAAAAGANGVDVVTADPELQQKARQTLNQRLLKLPGWQRPAIVEVHDTALPRTASRKVKRRELKTWIDGLLKQRATLVEAAEEVVVALTPVRLAIARTAGVEPQKLSPSTSLPADLGFDSLMWVELQGQLEQATGKTFDPEVLITKETVAEVEVYATTAASVVKQKPVPPSLSPERGEPEESALPPIVRELIELGAKAPAIHLARGGLDAILEQVYSRGFKVTVEGQAFVPANRNVICVANHTSHLDTGLVKYALGAYGQELRPLAAKDYFFEGNPLKVFFVKNLTNLVPIDRETGSGLAFEQAREVVQAGHVVLIFPEGTRREDGTLGSFKPLVAKLALATGVDVLPLYLDGCFDAFPRGAAAPKWGAPLRACIGPALPASELARLTAHLGPVQAARAAAEIIKASVVALKDGRALQLSRAATLSDLDTATQPLPSPARSTSA